MTPPAAATAAARSDRAIRRSPGPSGPRRVSGPAGGAGARAAARTRLKAAPGLSPRAHARGYRGGTPAIAGGAGILALPGRRIRSAVRTRPDVGTLSDRLLRSRAWIAVVAGLLIGLVFLQVSLLKVNAGIGKSVQQAAALEASNGTLRDQIAALSEDGRIAREATQAGMILPSPDGIRFLKKDAAGGVGGAAGATLAADAAAADGTDTTGTTDTGAVADAAATDGSGDTTGTVDGSSDTGVTDPSTDGSTDPASADTTSSPSTDTASADAGTGGDTSATGADASADSGGAAAPMG